MEDANGAQSGGTNLGRLLDVSLHDVPRGQRSEALAARLRRAVHRGSLPAGTRLPASRSLAQDLGVSRGVVVRAYEQLTAEGYLVARQGRGTEVAAIRSPPPTQPRAAPRPTANPGLPSGASFPRDAWLRATSQALRGLADADLAYGDPMGYLPLRRELSSYLGRVRSLLAPPERIVVVSGFAQASRMLADALLARGIDTIGVEDPGSSGLRDQLTRAGMRCVPIPVDDHGIRVDHLARTSVQMVVVTPAHQFPTGVVLHPERRHALLRWARDNDGWVVEDDYDAEFRYDRSPVGALQGLDPEVVVYGGSVSKTLAPGVRLGWLVVPEREVEAFAETKYAMDLATGVLDQATLAELLASGGFDRHIRRMGTQHRRRRDHLVAALAGTLPTWRVSGTAAGLHLVVHLPDGHDEVAVAAAAQGCGLDARPLSNYTVETRAAPGLVVGYGHQSPTVLRNRVGDLVAAMADGTGPVREARLHGS